MGACAPVRGVGHFGRLSRRWEQRTASVRGALGLGELQLADISDLRVLADLRKELPHFKIRHAVTIQQESLR